MNKTISTSLAGLVFHVEENGYEKLRNYLDAIRVRLGNSSDVEEIMADIEGRIAELFFQRTENRKEVVTLIDVEEVIAIMGEPQDYGEGSDQNETTQNTTEGRRKIYRSEDERMVGGVCAGIANYFDWEVTWIRIFFLLLIFFGGSGGLLYIALWIILPVAKTTAEKLQAKGQRVTSKSIEDHVKQFKNDVESLGKKAGSDRLKNAGWQLAEGFGRIAGFAAIFGALILTVFLIYWILTKDFVIPFTNTGADGFTLADLMDVTFTSWQQFLFDFGVICVAAGPIIGLFAFATRMVFRIKNNIKLSAIVSGGTWLLGVILICVVALGVYRDRSSADSVSSNLPVKTKESYIEMDIQDDIHFHNGYTNADHYFFELLKKDGDSIYVGWPKIDIVPSNSDQFEIEVIRESNGRTGKEAIRNAESITYDVEIDGNKIQVPPYFSFHMKDMYKGQSVILLVRVPNGKSVKLSDRMDRVLYDLGEERGFDDNEMAGKTWTMVDKKLHAGIQPLLKDSAPGDTISQ